MTSATVRLYWMAKDDNGKWLRHACEVKPVNHVYTVCGPDKQPFEKGLGKQLPKGYFQLRTYENGKTVWVTLKDGRRQQVTHPVLALHAFNKASDTAFKAVRVATRQAVVEKTDELYKLDSAIEAYKDHLTGKFDEAATQARLVLKEFFVVCSRAGVVKTHDIRAEHINAYMTSLEGSNSDRTRANKHDRVMIFAKWVNTKAGEDAERSGHVFKGDRINLAALRKLSPRPKFDAHAEVKTYSKAQIEALLNAADDYMTVVLNLGLRLGLREQEIMNAAWSDVNWKAKTLRVENKEDFKTKTRQGRTIPLGQVMFDLLKAWREKTPATRLIVGTASDKPNTHLLRALKRMAKNAGLNCKACKGCKSPTQECRKFGLHTLRRTYCTGLFRGKALDDKSIMVYMGHKDLATTLRYRDALKAAEERAQNAVTNIDFGD